MMQTLERFALLIMLANSFAARNQMARDYFVHKDVPNVVAFLCRNSTRDSDFIKSLIEEGISSAIFYPDSNHSVESMMRVEYSRLGVFLDLHCSEDRYSDFILTENSKLGSYDESYSWLLWGKTFNDSVRIINDDKFGISTDFVIATPAEMDGSYDLHDVYNHCKERQGKLIVTKYGFWDNAEGLTVTLVQDKYERRRDYHGMRLKAIAVTQYRPDDAAIEEYLLDEGGKPLDSMTKFGNALLMSMGYMFNFTMEITETSFWDQIDTDGTHLGMVGMLQRSEGDLGMSPAIMTQTRIMINELIGLVWPFRTCFMFRSIPTRISDEFIQPFTPGSWALIGVMCLVCMFVLGLFLKIEFPKEGMSRWSEAVVVVIGIMCQQGSVLSPKYVSSQLVIIHSLLFSILVYNYYSASVVSAQLNQPIEKMNDSLHQLAKSNLQIAAEPITYTNHGLLTIDDWEVKEFYSKRWKPLTDEVRYMSLEEGFKRVAEGGFAYHADPNTGYPYVERLFTDQMICELTEVHLWKPSKLALWGRRNSPFTEMAKLGLAKISSTGILARQVKLWASRKPTCFREGSTVEGITILTTAPAFMILLFGILIASFICVVENLVEKYLESHEYGVKPSIYIGE